MTTEETPDYEGERPEETKDKNTLEILEDFIAKGNPPDYVASELNSKGLFRICFRWEPGAVLHLEYDAAVYIAILSRFLDFWGPTFPDAEVTFQDPKGGHDENKK